MPIEISRQEARRFLADRHLLAPPRSLPATPESVLAVVDRLGSLQFDPISVAGRNHDLVLQARVAGYRRELTDELLYGRRLLFEAYNKALNLLPVSELPYYRITWQANADGRAGELLQSQRALADRILAEITAEGPRSSTDFEREAAIDWWWGPTTAVRAVLEAFSVSGVLGLARRDGNRRYFDLTERLYPADLLAERVPERDQLRHKVLSRYRGHGLLGATGSGELWPGTGSASLRSELRRELIEAGELVDVRVEGVRGERYVVAAELPLLERARDGVAGAAASPGCSFIAPLDPLLWDRGLLEPLYHFEYRWEVYTPAAKRRWGYYVLPILFGDRLVGRIEPRIDRAAATVRIIGLTWEPGFDPLTAPAFVESLAAALNAYLAFGGATSLQAPEGPGQRALFRELAAHVPLRRVPRTARAEGGVAARAATG